jgi:hypothetical protein
MDLPAHPVMVAQRQAMRAAPLAATGLPVNKGAAAAVAVVAAVAARPIQPAASASLGATAA